MSRWELIRSYRNNELFAHGSSRIMNDRWALTAMSAHHFGSFFPGFAHGPFPNGLPLDGAASFN